MSGRFNRAYVAVGVIWAAIQIPFLNSAFRIDEPLVLSLSEQIRRLPLDPYGISINWLGHSQAAFSFYANPPLLSYWISAWSCLFPWNEISLHLAVLPFSFLSLHGFDLIARSYKVNRILPAIMLCCSPAFLLASQVVMPDIVMFSFLVLSIGYALRYEEEGGILPLALSFLAGFLSPLAKYNGLVLVPILASIWLFSRRKPGIALIMAAPLSSTVLWGIVSWIQYGAPHIFAMAVFQQIHAAPPLLVLMGSMCAIGLAAVPMCALCFFPDLYRQKKVIPVLECLVLPSFFWIGLNIGFGYLSAALFALAALLALHFLIMTFWQGIQGFRQRDPMRFLLVVWGLAGVCFQAGLMFSSARYVLFLSPPLILISLVGCRSQPPTRVLGAAGFISLCLALAVAIADSRIAEAYRWIIQDCPTTTKAGKQGNLFFSGHWGLQYYAERAGGKHVDREDINPPHFKNGDLLIVADVAWPPLMSPPSQTGQQIEKIQIPFDPNWRLRTVDCGAAVNFYSCLISGCPRPSLLPFGIARGASEVFNLYVFK